MGRLILILPAVALFSCARHSSGHAGAPSGAIDTAAATTATRSSEVWTTGTPPPVQRVIAGSAVVDGKVYQFGGQSGCEGLSSADVYDPRSDTWSPLTPMPEARWGMGTAVVGGSVYLIGGETYGAVTSSVWRYTPVDEGCTVSPWKVLRPIGSPGPEVNLAGSPGAVGCRGKVYVVGGRGAGEVSACSSIAWYHVDTVWCYDPEDDSWSTRAPFPAGPTSSLTVASIGSKVYAVGGDQEGGTFLSSSYEYETEGDVWRQLPPLPEEVAHPCLGAVGKVLYVAGGWPAGTNDATGRAFKLGLAEEDGGWVELDPLPVPVFVAGSAVVGRDFYVLGGASGYGGHAVFETQVLSTGE